MGILERFLKEFEKERLFPVYLLLGEDRRSKGEVILQLRKRIFDVEDEEEASISNYYGDEATTEEIIETLTTLSIFSQKRLVVVHDFDRLKNVKPLIEYIDSPNLLSILVLLAEKKSVSKGIEDSVRKRGKACVFWPMFQNEGERWISGKLSELKIRAKPDALKYIIKVTGTNKNDLLNQVECISNYLGKGEVLTIDRAKKIIAKLYRYTVFDLCNRLFLEEAKDILEVFRWLVSSGEDLVKIEYFCSRELRKIIMAYSLWERDYPFHRIASELGFKKSEAHRIGNILNRISSSTIRKLFSNIVHLDYEIKTNPKEIAVFAFERFLLETGK